MQRFKKAAVHHAVSVVLVAHHPLLLREAEPLSLHAFLTRLEESASIPILD
jgi:hypothetical protein